MAPIAALLTTISAAPCSSETPPWPFSRDGGELRSDAIAPLHTPRSALDGVDRLSAMEGQSGPTSGALGPLRSVRYAAIAVEHDRAQPGGPAGRHFDSHTGTYTGDSRPGIASFMPR
jgi:hypothetical protein